MVLQEAPIKERLVTDLKRKRVRKQSTRLETYDNSWYQPGKKWKIVLWYFVNILFIKNTLNPFSGLKVAILRLFGARIGTNVLIKPGVNIKYPWLLEIGNNVWIGENVWIDNLAKITIEDQVVISQGAYLLTGNHNYSKSSFDLMVKGIHLKKGSWVAAKSIVCPGVTLETHAVLGVGSIATKDLGAYNIYFGTPAKFARKRSIS